MTVFKFKIGVCFFLGGGCFGFVCVCTHVHVHACVCRWLQRPEEGKELLEPGLRAVVSSLIWCQELNSGPLEEPETTADLSLQLPLFNHQ